ncbi:hypothetical protein ACGF0J_02545 [Nonomuraea sp. NPDC047897]|uniref:hypothetical protein n=1 Tax=Nonomuraea sp. NPDC047897 TaxID=3364346 RepID=UPI00371880E0
MSESPDDQIGDDLRDRMRIAALIILAVVHCGLVFPALLANLSSYRFPAVQLVVFGSLSLIIIMDALLEVAGRPRPRSWGVAWTVCVVLLSATASSELFAEQFFGTLHWTHLEVGWFVVVLFLGRKLSMTAIVIACYLAITLLQLMTKGLPSRVEGAGMMISALIVSAFQIATAAMANQVRDYAAAAKRAMRDQERLRTEATVLAQMEAERRKRYRELRTTIVPLLRGLADGSLSARDEATRRRCATEAARVRRLLVERDQASDALAHELHACIDAAERSGVDTQLAIRGAPANLPWRIASALTEPVAKVLAAARGSARVTVVRGDDSIRVSIVADAPRLHIPRPDVRGVGVSTLYRGQRLWLEVAYELQSSSSETIPS